MIYVPLRSIINVSKTQIKLELFITSLALIGRIMELEKRTFILNLIN